MRKRRKTFKRRGRSTINQTSKATTGQSLAFRGRKLKPRVYRSLLWKDGLLSTKYRSLQSRTSFITTSASTAVGSIGYITPLWLSNNAFWASSGGLRQTDAGVTPPLFSGDITLRGGIWGIQFRNSSSTLPVALRVYVGFTRNLPNLTLIPTTENVGWEPSISPDITVEVGKFHYNTLVQLEPGETFKLERRVRIQKISQTEWAGNGKMPIVMLFANNIGHSTATQIDFTSYYNLSFVADSIGTT